MPAMSLSHIFVYPVKGARGIALERATAGERGIAHDRRFMIVDPAGTFITQREYPHLALLETAIEGDALVLRSPEKDPIRLPIEPEGKADMQVEVWSTRCRSLPLGAEADEYVSAHLGAPARLVYMPDDVTRRVDTRYTKRKERVGFADAFPFLIATEASLADLNARLDTPVPMDRFRPNLVVRGAEAWAEDDWETLSVGDVVFHVRKPCDRCTVTTVDQATGKKGVEPLATLARFRARMKRVYFGQNLVVEGGGEVRIDDAVTVLPSSYPGERPTGT